MQWIKAVVYGNVWIALAAMATVWLFEGLGIGTVGAPLLALLFFATFFRYNLIGFTVSAKVTSEKFLFAWRHRKWFQVGAVLGVLGALWCVQWLNIIQLLLLAHLGIISLWYIFPLPAKIAPALRKLPYVKIFLIAYVWTVSAWLLPYAQTAVNWQDSTFWLSFAERFLFILAITLPFDIRDVASDQSTGVKTIPTEFGLRFAKNAGVFCLLGCAVLGYMAYSTDYWLILLFSYICTYLLLENSTDKRHDLYFLGWVDGILILQALSIMFYDWLSANY